MLTLGRIDTLRHSGRAKMLHQLGPEPCIGSKYLSIKSYFQTWFSSQVVAALFKGLVAPEFVISPLKQL